MRNQVFISLLFILTYSLGFAHNFVPHCSDVHLNGRHSETEHNHGHHSHDEHNSIDVDHSHVEHGDHFDEDFLDYLICLFEGNQHHDHSCDTQYASQDFEFKYSIEKPTQPSQVTTAECLASYFEQQSNAISTNIELARTQIDINSSSGRAPPHTYL